MPVVVVGNITVGGTGKTPMVIGLANMLKQHGYNPGIISRGYGRKSKGFTAVSASSKVNEVGDEALLIKRRTSCPVIVGSNRVISVKRLLDIYKCDVIISDDGLQHYKLPRHLEVALIDAEFKFGNKFCLPAGPLREPVSRLKQVDFVVRNFNTAVSFVTLPGEYSMGLEPGFFRNIKNPGIVKTAHDFKDQVVHAVAGIGMPQKFFRTLRQLHLDIIEHSFPDHYAFSHADFPFEKEIILMTEKDSVKCADQEWVGDNFWYMEVDVKLEARFIDSLLDKLKKT